MYAIARRLAGFQVGNDLPVCTDVHAAVDLLQRCIDEQNHFNAMLDLAFILESGQYNFRPDASRAVALYHICLSEANSLDAMYQLADIYANGRIGVARNPARALHLFQNYLKQANEDDPYALLQLANLHSTETDETIRNIPRAIQLYETCIETYEDSTAMYSLANIFADQSFHLHDFPRAVQLYQASIDHEQQNFKAMQALAHILLNGAPGVDKDVPRAVALYDVCVLGVDDMQLYLKLATLLIAGKQGVERDVMRAVHLCDDYLQISYSDVRSVIEIAKDAALGTPTVVVDREVAICLLEICLDADGNGDPTCMRYLTEILLACSKDEKVAGRMLYLFQQFVNQGWDCCSVADVVRLKLLHTRDVACDVSVAVRLLQICIDFYGDETGAASVRSEVLQLFPSHDDQAGQFSFQSSPVYL